MTLHELVEGCQAQQTDAQKELYRLYGSKVMGVCVRYSDSKEDAKDIFQESFIKIYRSIHKLKNVELLGAWMKKIAVNTAINYFHKLRKNAEIWSNEEEIEASQNDDYQKIMANLSKQDLVKLINELAPGYRMVFNLYVVEGYSHKEIADLLNTSETNSKNQLMKAKRTLQKKLIELNLYEKYESG
jgi:RNA polymerase sigma-70 factor (ECF subfamily)